MTNQEFIDHLVRLDACTEALVYVRSHPSDDARTIWETCNRLDWLLWLGVEVGLRADVRSLACDYAERALPIWESWAREHAPEHLDAPRAAIDAARRGVADAARDAYAAADRAAAARDAYAAAERAAYAARAAARAAYAADDDDDDAAHAAADVGDAARDAYDYAARAAERAWQLAHTRSILTWDRIEKALVTP